MTKKRFDQVKAAIEEKKAGKEVDLAKFKDLI